MKHTTTVTFAQPVDPAAVRPHIVGIGQTVIFVETVLQRKELLLAAQMPLSEYRSAVAFLFQQLSHRHLLRMDAVVGIRPGSSGKAYAVRIASGQQSGTRSATDRLPGEKVGEAYALGRHLVDIGCRIAVCSVEREVAITDIIQIDNDKIRIIGRLHGKGQTA